MGKENERDGQNLLDQFVQALSKNSQSYREEGRVVLHVMPDRVIAETRKHVENCTSSRFILQRKIRELEQTLAQCEATLLEINRTYRGVNLDQKLKEAETNAQDVCKKVNCLGTYASSYRSQDTTESYHQAQKEYEIANNNYLTYHRAIQNFQQATREKAQIERELLDLRAECGRLEAIINQYESLIMNLLSNCTK